MQPLILLHGAIGAADQLEPLAVLLSEHYKVYKMDFAGHGQKPFPDEDFSIELFARNVLAFIEEQNLESTSIFGYSMGGYVGMYLAKHHPEKINKIVTLATKFYWDEATAARETQMLDAEKIAVKVPAFAEALDRRHFSKDWKEVLHKTSVMLTALGAKNALEAGDYKDIAAESLLLLGDRDKMVTLEETLATYKNLPAAQLGILPGTAHPIEQVDTRLLAYMIRHFIK